MNLQSILGATDFSECSGSAFQTFARLAQTFQAKLILLHVISLKRVAVLADYPEEEAEAVVVAAAVDSLTACRCQQNPLKGNKLIIK